jgi:hypothetical protein
LTMAAPTTPVVTKVKVHWNEMLFVRDPIRELT